MKNKFFTFLMALLASISILYAESGTCGKNLTWVLEDSILTINGTGDMYDYLYYGTETPPWWNKHEAIKSIEMSDGITSIGNHAFYSCINLLSIALPNSLTKIGDGALGRCYLLSIITLPDGILSIGGNAFYACQGLQSLIIPNSVLNIDYNAFNGCIGLTSLTIGNSVTNIGNKAFYLCENLTDITIPNSVVSIGEYAFAWCSKLITLTLGENLTSYGEYAFSSCPNLKTIYNYRVRPATLNTGVFLYINPFNCTLYVPNGSVDMYKSSLSDWSELFYFILPFETQEENIEFISPDNHTLNHESKKFFNEGQIYILRGDRTYTLTGQEIK